MCWHTPAPTAPDGTDESWRIRLRRQAGGSKPGHTDSTLKCTGTPLAPTARDGGRNLATYLHAPAPGCTLQPGNLLHPSTFKPASDVTSQPAAPAGTWPHLSAQLTEIWPPVWGTWQPAVPHALQPPPDGIWQSQPAAPDALQPPLGGISQSAEHAAFAPV